MKNILSEIDAPTFTLSAVVIGFLLTDDLSPSEQNSIGNWFMMIGQVLCTNASQQQVLNNNNKNDNNNSPHIINNQETDMDTIKRSVNIMNEQLRKF